ncbi:SWI/SNF complex subunit SWI3C homolog [Lolium rigidum]|uniref:SWI/SNF complex subunit SWI3C homolog n=1 Tax=Lolium rigidum TaxID=89674 RepID=UPI001F5CB057|nr:SWI/SNF complex subunit SWI3C homolog [Lolium rigidum]
MPRKASSSSDAKLKWRKRKRSQDPSPSKPDHSDDSDSAPEDDAPHASANGAQTLDDDDLRDAEVLSSSEPISAFPAAARRTITRVHPSVLAAVAADRAVSAGDTTAPGPALENISHGQLQVLAAMLPDHPSLSNDPDKPSSYVCTVPPLMEGQGVPKQFYGKLLLVPRHADWFSPATVHRLERQVVPHFFSGKSPGNTPEKYIMLRNKVIVKYLERPVRRLAFAECQGLVTNTTELYDLSRIVRFLDTWGIINYLAAGSVHRGLRLATSLVREEQTGELQLQSAPLKSIDGLVLFDRPKCSVRAEDIASVASTSSALEVPNGDTGLADLDEKIWERLSESFCSYCLQPLPSLHYESQKEADIALCSDCFHDARFVPGHSSLDFQRVDGTKDGLDNDGDSWTDDETLLLLEGVEKYNDNWNGIADHVGTKSKAQCIHHFIRLPVEDGLLESMEVPEASVSSRVQSNGFSHSNSNGSISGSFPQSSQPGQQLPFVNSANPVMSLVAFLASAVGPRIAASCANAALSVLTRDDSRMCPEGNDAMGQAARPNYDASSSVSPENVKYAAMCGLSAAATKCKLFADQEEREIQRLAATIINHQLKRLELKLKQFAEVETLLLKESEQVERGRQNLNAQRTRVMSARFGSSGGPMPGGSSTMASNPMNQANPRPPAMQGAMPPANMQAYYANNMQGHPAQLAFLQQQQQQQQQQQRQQQQQQQQHMLSFGPRLPLSAIHPGSTSAPSVMFNPGTPNSATQSHHPMLRPPTGNNSSFG